MLRNDMALASKGDRVRQGGQFCSAINCQNGRFKLTSKGKRFHNFPKDEERCKIWMDFTRRKDFDHLTPSDVYGKGYCLCSDHFEESQYNCPTQKKSLVWNAVPTVFSIPNPPCKVTSSRKRPMDRMSKPTSAKQPRILQKAVVLHEEQADIAVEPACSRTVPDSPTKAELKMEITNLKEKLSSLMEELNKKETKKHSRNRGSQKKAEKASILKQLSTILPSESMTFFTSQLRENNKSKNGYRWTENDKALDEIFSSHPVSTNTSVSTDTLNSSESISKCMEANTWLTKTEGNDDINLQPLSKPTENKHPCPVKNKRPVKRTSKTGTGCPKIVLKTIKMEDNPDIGNIGMTSSTPREQYMDASCLYNVGALDQLPYTIACPVDSSASSEEECPALSTQLGVCDVTEEAVTERLSPSYSTSRDSNNKKNMQP
ncbi:uncharacterized protein LOC112554286 [Pomacea canaliculata]|uniref:uncharacterized protein LOC112554286 n=1 Tax=Pomacea canaliculata TaxID=400727 RepID=UPI000D733893|nr:uncharacterized protein LOC112554286 [Pomacea canaliculata]